MDALQSTDVKHVELIKAILEKKILIIISYIICDFIHTSCFYSMNTFPHKVETCFI